MVSGRKIQLTRQIGEHTVAAKLGRLGYIATPFAGNVPDFDLLIANDLGYSIPIQVKAINGTSAWQFKIDKFLDIEIVKDVQNIKGKRKLANPNLVCVFVLLSENENDQYFILQLKDLQDFFFSTYKSRKRPKNPISMHCAAWPKDLIKFRDNWDLVKKTLEPTG